MKKRDQDSTKRIFIGILIMYTAIILFSCEKDNLLNEDAKWITYSSEDGFVCDWVKDIAVDAQNVIWFATDKGVIDYDGFNFNYTRNFDTDPSGASAIAIDRHGNIWVGSGAGRLCQFDGNNWKIYDSKDNLPRTDINAITIDDSDNIWLGIACMNWDEYCIGGGVWKYDGSDGIIYNKENGLVNDYVYAVAVDAHNEKWFGTGSGVSKFDGTNWTTYKTSDGLVSNRILAIAIDYHDNKWFGTVGGISKFDGVNWTTYTISDGISNNIILSIAVDSENNKWFGTKGGGVMKFDDINWTNYSTYNGLANDTVPSIAIDNTGNIWFGTNGGVTKYEIN